MTKTEEERAGSERAARSSISEATMCDRLVEAWGMRRATGESAGKEAQVVREGLGGARAMPPTAVKATLLGWCGCLRQGGRGG